MDRLGIPLAWTAAFTTLRMIVALLLAGESQTAVLFIINVAWHVAVLGPFWVRIYFSASAPRDLLVDVLDVLDMVCASAALSPGWWPPPWHVQYAAAVLLLQMGIRPTAARPMALASAAALADAEYARIRQEADLRVLPPMTGAGARTRARALVGTGASAPAGAGKI